MGYYVTYKNEGRPERTQIFTVRAEAQASATFLKAQGATSIRVRRARPGR